MPEVETPAGRVRGLLIETPDGPARAFLGVPYGSARERFRPAAPVEPWRGVRDATRPGPLAPQSGSASSDEHGCLTVNVWTPPVIDRAAPVLAWIHGGLHVVGSNSEPLCDGARLAARTGTVVVAVGHRLGALGFLTLDHLLGDAYRDSANTALHDVIAALEWVRSSIRAFGGDPVAVTLAGQSAGATTVAMLLAAERASGLFHRAVLHSANPERVGDRAYGEAVTDDLLGILGVQGAPHDLLETPWPALVAAQDELLARRSTAGPTTVAVFRPAVDGRLLTRPPVEAVAAGASSGVDLIVGTNLDEGSAAVDLRAGDGERMRAQLAEHLREMLPAWADDRSLAYRDALALDRGRMPTDAEALAACLADEVYRQPSLRLLDARAGAAASTRSFLFEWRVDDSRGAAHSLELPFLFRHLDGSATALAEVGAEAPHALSDAIADTWARFAAGDALAEWPEYSPRRSTLVLDGRVRVEEAPYEAVRELVARAHRSSALDS